MILHQRRQKMMELINREGQITFSRLKQAFPGVSEMTLRTDLKYLDESKAIIRIHGGAKSIGNVAGSDGYLAHRIISNQEEKARIVEKALPLLAGKSSLFLDSGSTTTLLARSIPDESRMIFTNSISCVTELSSLTRAAVNVLGGRLNRYSLSVAGSRSILELRRFHFDICFLGVTSFSPAYGFCCESEEDCLLKQVVLQQSDCKVVLMDSAKFGRSNTHCICTAGEIDILVSDDKLTKEQQEIFTGQGVTVC